jgi:alkanesulfonate monooxygenase SsuD/methylene tetrahydromethanopterin reductase-like flavin-dependent oxidoreductase (luciferase family)
VREYLTVVRTLLADGNVSFKGEQYRVTAFLDVEGGGTPPVLLAALHEQLCRTAGAHADGVLPWLAPASHVASTIVPNVRTGAQAAGRAAPPVIAEIPVVVSGDRDAVMDAAKRELAMYLHMPFYADLLVQAGVPDAADAATGGWTDAMVDAVVPWGDEDALAAKLQAYVDAGADEVVVSPIGVGPDPAASVARSLEVLGDIARG